MIMIGLRSHNAMRRAIRCFMLLFLLFPLALMQVNAIGVGQAWAGTNPSTVVSGAFDANNDTRYAFFVCVAGSDPGSLCEAFYNGSRWSEQTIPGMGQLLSPPSVSLDVDPAHESGRKADPYQYVFWRGPGPRYDLTEAYWNGTWHGPVDLGMGPLGSGPSSPQSWYDSKMSGNPLGETVAWRGSGNDQLWYATSDDPTNPGSWKGASQDPGITNVTSQPSVVDAGGGQDIAFYRGSNAAGSLYAADFPSSSTGVKWGPCDFGQGTLGSNPSASWSSGDTQSLGLPPMVPRPGSEPNPAGSCPVDNVGQVWYGSQPGFYSVCWSGTGSGLWCMWWWVGSQVALAFEEGPRRDGSMGVLGSAPSLAQWGPNGASWKGYAFWEGSGNRDLYETRFDTKGKPKNTGIGPVGP